MQHTLNTILLNEIDQSSLSYQDRAFLALTYLGLKPNSIVDFWTQGSHTMGEQKDEFLVLLNKTGLLFTEYTYPDQDTSRTWNCAYGHTETELNSLITMSLSQHAFVTEEFGVLLGYPRSAAAQFQTNPYYLTEPIVREMIKKLRHIMIPVRLSLDEVTARKEVEEIEPWLEALKKYLPKTYQELYENWQDYCEFGTI
jgi:hypothetical protein